MSRRIPIPYATLEEYKLFRTVTSTKDDALIAKFLYAASSKIETGSRRWFVPRQLTRYYDHPADATQLDTRDDLLEVIELKTNGGDVTVDPSDFWLACVDDYNLEPYDRIIMDPNGDQPYLEISDTGRRSTILTAWWGYHEWYSESFLEASTLVGDLTTSATSFNVQVGEGPLYEAYQVVRAGNELMLVTGVTDDTLTVTRGVQGTTAATHSTDDDLTIFQVWEDVNHTTLRLTDYYYQQRGNKDNTVTRTIITPNGAVILPTSVPKDIADTITAYRVSGQR